MSESKTKASSKMIHSNKTGESSSKVVGFIGKDKQTPTKVPDSQNTEQRQPKFSLNTLKYSDIVQSEVGKTQLSQMNNNIPPSKNVYCAKSPQPLPSNLRMDSLGSPSRDGFVRQPVYIPLDASKQEISIHNFLSTQNVF